MFKDSYNRLISSILNIDIKDIETINVVDNDIYVIIKHKDNLVCPYCNSNSYIGNGSYKRDIIIDNDFIIKEKVHLKVRRYYCQDCHHSFNDLNQMCPSKKRISYKMIFRIMELLKSAKITFSQVAALTGLSIQTVIRVFDKHTHIERIRLPEAICIDEVYTKNNDYKNSKYSCIIYDFIKQNIVDVLPCRRKEYLHYYFKYLSKEELDNVKYVCIDMYQPYKDIAQRYFKKAIISVDSFHVVKHLNDDLNKVRIRIMNSYDTSSNEYYLLKTFKYLLFSNSVVLDNKAKYNKRFKCYLNYRQLLNMILSINADLALSYQLTNQYLEFNRCANKEEASKDMDLIIDGFIKANINEYQEFTSLLINWKEEIINSFTKYKNRRLNSGIAESINQNVSALIYNSKGIRNWQRRRKRIMYSINKEGFSIQ